MRRDPRRRWSSGATEPAEQHGIHRRDFFLATAGGILGLSGGSVTAQSSDTGRLGRIGLQLYTLRHMAKRDLARTLASVARAGYREVEFAGLHGHPAARVRKMLDDNGLTSPATHVSMSDLGLSWSMYLDEANVLGQNYLVVSWIDKLDRTFDGYNRIADRLNEAGVKARGENVQLGYHNNAYEFAPIQGTSGYEILLRECDPLNLVMEADIFWMRSGGQDPLAWFARYPGRFHMLHVKDMGRAPKNEMVDVGKGVIDWRAILGRRLEAGVRHVFVEHDEPGDPLGSIRSSYRYLRALRFMG